MNPADQPPPDPDRGDPGKIRAARVLFAVAVLCLFTAGIGSRYGWVAVACATGTAAILAVVGVAVLAGKGGKS